ncbi:hypothetical protein D3C84_1118070 [compost metagenome]
MEHWTDRSTLSRSPFKLKGNNVSRRRQQQIACSPLAFVCNIEWLYFITAIIKFAHYRQCGAKRHFVFPRFSPIDKTYANLLAHSFFLR